MKISVITPTCDRPVGLALTERWMRRQTVQPDQWVLVDGGVTAALPTMGQQHIRQPSPPGAANFAGNLLAGITAVTGNVCVVIEDDDLLQPNHIESLVQALESNPAALLAGDDHQWYYNVAHRCWRKFDNVGASLCQTAMRRAALPLFESITRQCLAAGKFGIDTTLWRAVPKTQWALTGEQTCIGIKGLPGQPGLGIGHRPNGAGWHADPELKQLREWVGDDADAYAGYRRTGQP